MRVEELALLNSIKFCCISAVYQLVTRWQ